jgi:hypothetical protein
MPRQDRRKRFTVLLLYPDYMHNSGELNPTYLAHVKAKSADHAVTLAQYEAVRANKHNEPDNADDFARLLVVRGHHSEVY